MTMAARSALHVDPFEQARDARLAALARHRKPPRGSSRNYFQAVLWPWMVGRAGLEPATYGLKGPATDLEITAHRENKPDRDDQIAPDRTPREPIVQSTSNQPTDAATLEGAIAKLTRTLLVAADEDVPGIVAERASLRAELRAIHHASAGNVFSIEVKTK